MHGGIGVTFEHDLHLFLRRVIVDRALAGTPADHLQRIAACGRRTGRGSGVSALASGEQAEEMESLEDFRQRARTFIRSNLRQVTPEELRSAGTAMSEEAELAAVSPGPRSSSACSSTPTWPASASRAPTAVRG